MIHIIVIPDEEVVEVKAIEEADTKTIVLDDVVTVTFYYGEFGVNWDANTSIGKVYRIVKNNVGQVISKAVATDITWAQRLTATYTAI